MHPPRWLSVVPVCLVMGATALAQPGGPEAVVANVRQALGIETMSAHPTGIRLTGSSRMAGVDGQFEMIADGHGRFMERISGPIGVTYGYDGTLAWTEDLGGERRLLECGDRETAMLGALIMTGDVFAPGSPVEFAPSNAEGVVAGSVTLTFKLKDGLTTGSVDIDRATWLPRHWSFGQGEEKQNVTFTGSVNVGAVKFPAKIEQVSHGGMSVVVTVTNGADAPTFVRSPYEPVLTPPTDVKFDPKIAPALEVKKAPTGHLLVHPTVAGKDLGWFIFDTGAGSNCLDQRAAEKLGVEKFGAIPASGVGGSVTSSLCRPETLALGPVTLDKPLMVILDFAFLDQYMGTEVGGIIGYGMLQRVIAEIDAEQGKIALHDPAAFKDDGLAWQALTLYGRHPCVQAAFEDHKGLFKLDTGAAQSTVTIHAPAVERFKLLDGRETKPAMHGGVGGMAAAKVGKVKWFELGGVRSENLEVIFAIDRKGAFDNEFTLGNIGGQLLKPFRLVTD